MTARAMMELAIGHLLAMTDLAADEAVRLPDQDRAEKLWEALDKRVEEFIRYLREESMVS